ncbi:hypothetical protein Glove_519g21 [Diversispora epigaea]|uniref:Mechanosensitive ion channel MscS domain-containing protein n=1 Tax=Diversispora epigaea TaxID=1348612 RepID=A0A397GHJ2_9GLOM|nr:hypothetical protein Glove_519g21 [Diversispora epigaea]
MSTYNTTNQNSTVLNFLDNDNKLFPIILMAGVTVASMLLHLALAHILKSRTGWLFDHAILKYCKIPSFFVFSISAILLTLPFISDVDSRLLIPIQHTFEILLIIFSTWTAVGVVKAVVETIAFSNDNNDSNDNNSSNSGSKKKKENRKIATQLLVASRVVISIIFTLGVACVLSTFPTAWNLGMGLVASASIIALILGFAARQTLTNLLATLQIALTQSVILGDYVVVDNYQGVVEEIQSQYIVLKSIEEKRILVPLSKLINTTYENWSRSSEKLSLGFELYVDYGIPLDDLRNYFISEVCKCEYWDQRNALLYISDVRESVLVLTARMTTTNFEKGNKMKIIMREKLIEYITTTYPQYLPRIRNETVLTRTGIDSMKKIISKMEDPVLDDYILNEKS